MLPDESGLDDSPKYDPVYGRMAHWRPGYFRLVERCRRLRWDSRAILARTDEHVEDVLVNVAHALSGRALARLLAGAGRHEEAAAQVARAQRTEAALLERCWDERRGLFFDLAGRGERRVEVSTWSALGAARARRGHPRGDPPPARRGAPAAPAPLRGAVRDPVRVDGRAGVHARRFDRFRTWRGPAWINTAWLLVPPLRALGYADEADRIVERLAARGLAARLPRVLRPAHRAAATARAASAGRRSWSTCSRRLPARGRG